MNDLVTPGRFGPEPLHDFIKRLQPCLLLLASVCDFRGMNDRLDQINLLAVRQSTVDKMADMPSVQTDSELNDLVEL